MTVAMSASWPRQAPIHSASWLPQVMARLRWRRRASITRSMRGPRSPRSPATITSYEENERSTCAVARRISMPPSSRMNGASSASTYAGSRASSGEKTQLVEDARERRGKHAPRVAQAVARHQHAEQLELAHDRVADEGRARRRHPGGRPRGAATSRAGSRRDSASGRARRCHRARSPNMWSTSGRRLPGAVAQDVLQLLELAVNVADDVDRAARQREDRREMRDLGERRRHVGQPITESAQVRERGARTSGSRRSRSGYDASPW